MALTSITNIPTIMRANRWNNGAQLMKKWFEGPPVAKPAYTSPDVTTIKMDGWVLTFQRAKDVFDAMIREKVWMNDKAKTLLVSRLRSVGMLTPVGRHFDFSAKSTPDQHAMHVNFRQVESGYSSSLDDMVAALGNFSIYVTALSGDVSPEGGRSRVKLSRLGFHIMDSYDFEGDQDLGYWDESTNRASPSFMMNGTQVGNDTFRKWRATKGKGGDFLVYSDVKVVSLTAPDSFLL